MNGSYPSSLEESRLLASFEGIRQALLSNRADQRLHEPLSYWAMPQDRRLPLALLGKTLLHILETPFRQLAATPGIGQKKMGALVILLERALNDQSLGVDLGSPGVTVVESLPVGPSSQDAFFNNGVFDGASVSESYWREWCGVVRRFQLENDLLGRLAPSLRRLPTIIWETSLRDYVDLSLAEIRGRPTHGPKRVHAILEVFHSLHAMLDGLRVAPHFCVRLTIAPAFVGQVETWLEENSAMCRSNPLALSELRQGLFQPLLAQIQVDAGSTVFELASARLGMDDNSQTVQVMARRRRLTPARIYQLLEICSHVMRIRWPEGRQRLSQWWRQFDGQAQNFSGSITGQIEAAQELFFGAKNAKNAKKTTKNRRKCR